MSAAPPRAPSPPPRASLVGMHVPDVPAEGYEIQAPVVALNGLLDAADVDANGNDVDPDFSDEENEEANAPVGTTYQRSYR